MAKKKSNVLKITEPQMGYALDFDSQRVKSKPFIKWAGGKWQLLPIMSRLMPPRQQIGRYFEPFLGGAAVFFYLQHPKSILSDSNEELIKLYKVVQENVEELIRLLKVYKMNLIIIMKSALNHYRTCRLSIREREEI